MLYMIAYNEKTNTIRLFDTEAQKTRDITCDNVVNGLRRGASIENLSVENGKLVGTRGALSRYRGQACTILSSIESEGKTVGFVACNIAGTVKKISYADTITIAEKYGLSNAKVSNGAVVMLGTTRDEIDTLSIEKKVEAVPEQKKQPENIIKAVIKAAEWVKSDDCHMKLSITAAEAQSNKIRAFKIELDRFDEINNLLGWPYIGQKVLLSEDGSRILKGEIKKQLEIARA